MNKIKFIKRFTQKFLNLLKFVKIFIQKFFVGTLNRESYKKVVSVASIATIFSIILIFSLEGWSRLIPFMLLLILVFLDTIAINRVKFTEDEIKKIARYTLIYTFLSFTALLIITPFYWMILTALKSKAAVEAPVPQLFTFDLHFENFIDAYKSTKFNLFFRNTLIVAFFGTLGTIITTILAAFAFARLQFKGRDTLFTVLLSTMMIPGEMLVITNFVTVKNWHWDDTFLALIVPFMTSVFYIFFLRQTFKQIPNELYLAAKVDGTSDFKYLLRVMIPIAKPTIITILILNSIGAWNAYVWPSLVTSLSRQDLQLVSNGLRGSSFVDELGMIRYNWQMAGSTIVTLPILIVFLILKKHIMRGVSRSGIKG